MRVDDLVITEDISVLDAMRKLDETGLGVLFVAPEGVLRAVVTAAAAGLIGFVLARLGLGA